MSACNKLPVNMASSQERDRRVRKEMKRLEWNEGLFVCFFYDAV